VTNGGRQSHGDASPGAAPWRRHLLVAACCAGLGLVVHEALRFLPPSVATLGLGIGLIGASFMLAWAADAGEAVFSGGPVLAAVALVGVLPEFTIEVHFAFIQEAELVTANLTGATRLLLTGAIGLPLLVVFLAHRSGQTASVIRLAGARRLELGILLVVAVFAAQVVVRGSLTVFDGVLLLGLYVLYARRVQGTPDEEPAVVGVAAGLLTLPERYRRPAVAGLILAAAAVVVTIANPFTQGLLATGSSVGIDPYLMIQSVVPVATEAPEIVVVAVLVASRRPAQGLALFLASSVSQWTLGMGALPIAYLAGGGGLGLPIGPREQLELAFTGSVTLFVVAALATMHPERADAFLAAGVFAAQMIWPTPFVRLAAAFVLFVFAVNLLIARRRDVRPLLRAVFRRSGRPGTGTAGGPIAGT
jgi:cation:H+ antiporter